MRNVIAAHILTIGFASAFNHSGNIGPLAAQPSQSQIYFEPNVGQADANIEFIGRARDYSALISGSSVTLVLPDGAPDSKKPPQVVRLEFSSDALMPDFAPTGVLPGHSNYFLGSDSAGWHTNVAHYSGLRGRLGKNLNLIYRSIKGELEYDLEIGAHAAAEKIGFQVTGARALRVDESGDLIMETGAGVVRQHKPSAYQIRGGVTYAVESFYELVGHDRVLLRAKGYDPALPFTIDPVVSYSGFVGVGTGLAVAVDPSGNAYVTGYTSSASFSLKNPLYSYESGGSDVFVSKFDPTGSTLVYSTYLGSSYYDQGTGIAADASGNAYVTGYSGAADFPLRGSLQPYEGNQEAFVTELSPDGSDLVFSTFLGGSGNDVPGGIALDKSRNIYVAGTTSSGDFPLVNPLQVAVKPLNDAFLTILAPSGSSIIMSTFFGGTGDDGANAVAVDPAGQGAWIGGYTTSTDLPLLNAFQVTLGSGIGDAKDGFVAHIGSDGSLLYSSYVGGRDDDAVTGIAVAADETVILYGSTTSFDFPMVLPLMTAIPGHIQCFVAKLNQPGGPFGLQFSTAFGSDDMTCGNVALDPAGNIAITGMSGQDFPSAAALGPGIPQSLGIFAAKIAQDNSHILYATFLGAFNPQISVSSGGIAVDASGAVYVTGGAGNGIPIVNAYKSSSGGQQNATLTKITDDTACLFDSAPPTLAVPNGGGTLLIEVTLPSNCWWAPSPIKGFGTVAYTSLDGTFEPNLPPYPLAEGSGAVGIAINANSAPPDRTFGFTVSGATILLQQPGTGCGYQVPNNTGSFSEAAQSGTFFVFGNNGCTPTAQSNAAWITILRPLITGGTVIFNLFANAGAARTGTISVAGLTYTVHQAGFCTATFNAPSQSFTIAGGSGSANVQDPDGCAWTITNDNTTLINSSSPLTGTTSAAINFTVAAGSFLAQHGALHLASGGAFTVTESGTCIVGLNPMGASFPAAGGSGSFTVTTSGTCQTLTPNTSSNPPMMTITSGPFVPANGIVTYSVLANGTTPRSSLIQVGDQSFLVTQDGAACSYTLFSNSANLTSAGREIGPTLSTPNGCPVTAVSNAPWITATVVPTTGGSPDIRLYVSLNLGTSRTGTATIGTATFTINQAGTAPAQAAYRDASGGIHVTALALAGVSDAGGAFAGDPGAAADPDGNLVVAAVDTSHAMWANVYNPNLNFWDSWRYGGGAFQGVPGATVTPDGTAWIAGRDTSNSYWLTSFTKGSGWGIWAPLGGAFSSDPVMTSCLDGSVYLVGKDNQNSVWAGRYVPGTGFQNWTSLAGVIKGNLSVTCDQVLYIVGRDFGNSVWIQHWTPGTYTGWSWGGGNSSGDPKVVALGNVVAVMIIDPAQSVWRTTFGVLVAGWQPWIPVGGQVQDLSPAGVNGELQFVGRDAAGSLWWWDHSTDQWRWVGYEYPAGALASAPR